MNNEPTELNSLYLLEVVIKDTEDTVVGKAFRQAPKDEPVECTSPLPHILQVFAGAEDWDYLRFMCASQSWEGDDRQKHRCSFGRVENGKAEGNCAFDVKQWRLASGWGCWGVGVGGLFEFTEFFVVDFGELFLDH